MTVFFTAPTAYKAMVAAGRGERLRGAPPGVSAGEHLPAATWQAFLDATGVRIIDGIGSTEMLHIFISSADDDIRPGSTGRAVPGYVATVGRPRRRTPAAGRERTAGRAGRPAADISPTRGSAVYVQDGWNITGDTFVQDEDGYFWYRARSDDMIVSSGYNIAGPEVEQALLGHPDVVECAVVGVPRRTAARSSRRTSCCAPASPPTTPLGGGAAGLRQGGDRAVQVPAGVLVLDALPRTSTGKRSASGTAQAPALQAATGVCARQRRYRLARNDRALHLRCALVDPRGPDLPVEVLEQVSALQRPRAVDLDGGVDDVLGGLRSEQLGHRRAAAIRVAPASYAAAAR